MPDNPEQPQKIDVGDLTENITLAVQRAFQAQGVAVRPFGRIIIGIIIDPTLAERAQSE
jgi:hypothetical protein